LDELRRSLLAEALYLLEKCKRDDIVNCRVEVLRCTEALQDARDGRNSNEISLAKERL
jgi:hypothetical protein